jgi:hypothetical protein
VEHARSRRLALRGLARNLAAADGSGVEEALTTKADGTVGVDMDPLSLLCRLATSVPPPRFHPIHSPGFERPSRICLEV